MNWRALGCGLAAAIVFVGLGLAALGMALSGTGCPDRLQDGPRAYLPEGEASSRPQVPGAGADAEPVEVGTTLIGIVSRAVYTLPEEAPESEAGPLPERIALDCGDGTFRGYRLEGSDRSGSP